MQMIMGEQQQLQSLVHDLKWSYVALWSFNSLTRNLEWRAGHWRQSDTQGWNEQYFNSTFKSCQFGTRFGSVGLAFAERRKLWMNGSKVVDNAGSKELVDFLRRARILTAIIIPWSDGVLELGTSENVPKDQSLVDLIERYFLNKIVPTLYTMLPPMPVEQGYSSLSPLNYSQSFEPNSLNQQIIRRGSSMSNPSDMFLHEEITPEGGTMLLDASKVWKMPTTTTAPPVYYPPVQQRTRGQYRSRSNTTSSSVSSLDERLSAGDSPDQLFMASSTQRQTSHSNTSSSPTRAASSHSPEMTQLEVTPGGSLQEARVEEMNQLDALTMMLADGAPLETGGTYNFPSLETSNLNVLDSQSAYNINSPSPFKEWRQSKRIHPKRNVDGRNQFVLRRCIEIMKQISLEASNNNNNNNINNVPMTQNDDSQAVMHNVGQHGPRVASSSSPETIANDPFDQLRVQRRPRGGSRIATMGAGAVHSGHDEAAKNHMLAERRRRVKQKENFAALRRLVPIISKADKASILGDAIVYLKDLQDRIEGLQMNRAQSERRYEALQKSYKELQDRNKELESMVHNPATRLHSI